MRVVSLVPSATELLCAIPGGSAMLIGRSHECDWPPDILATPALTAQTTRGDSSAAIDREVRETLASGRSLYALDVEQLTDLEPDVILTQDLCSVCSIDIESVRTVAAQLPSPPQIISTNPTMLEDVFDDLLIIGNAVGLSHEADDTLVRLRERYWSARDYANAYLDGEEVAFLEWIDPMFCGGHWTPQLITDAGCCHSLNAPGTPSREVSRDELIQAHPARIIICPCGFDIRRTRDELATLTSQRWWKDLPAVRHNRVAIVDGNHMFNRPGPRLVDAFEWLVGWLNNRPNVIPHAFPWESLSHQSITPATHE